MSLATSEYQRYKSKIKTGEKGIRESEALIVAKKRVMTAERRGARRKRT